jgi:23S rRNA (uracil1939-C5)-methyltransferase
MPAPPLPVLTIDALGARGDGVGRLPDGRAAYVPLSAPGDRVRVRPGAKRGDGVAADLVELVEPGPARAQPPCPHFGDCGGCALQHLAEEAYGAYVHARVAEPLARAGLGRTEVGSPIRVPPGDRRRVVLAARRTAAGVVLGFNARRSGRIVDVRSCLVADPALVALLPALREVLARVLPAGAGLDVSATVLDDGLDVVLVGRLWPGLAEREALAAFADAADLARLTLRAGPRAAPEPLAWRRDGVVRFAGVPVRVPPGGFLQASRAGEAALAALVADGVGGARRVADLFAGSGTFAVPLAAGGAAVHAVEGDAEAHAALSAVRLPRLTTARRDLERDPLGPSELDGFDAVVFDPPRAGAAAQAAEIAKSRVPVVVGVSCSPETFARDARTLADGGYALARVVPVDQFLWSPHVELAGVFRRG